MKKIIALLLCALTLILTLTGCTSRIPKRKNLKVMDVPTGITYTLDLSQFPLESGQERDFSGQVCGITEDGLYVVCPRKDDLDVFGAFVLVRFTPPKNQTVLKDDYLQIKYINVLAPEKEGQPLVIEADSGWVDVPAYKPVIYLYPTQPTECSVRVDIDGVLTCTYPDHGTDGWQGFTACPDGTLIFPDGREYYCLYWEGLQHTAPDFTTGFCVRGCDTAAFLADALPKLGLSPREAQEMIIYWLPRMQDNAYNVISFQTTAYTDGARLDVTPAPDTLIRVFMAWYGTDEAVDLPAQTLTAPERTGFTLVEWGGTETN
ncbi:MAG: hypothetical protein MJ192_06000 [Clostridia bacterium]|nr:hypothetical protein [Clostridia bacterium]